MLPRIKYRNPALPIEISRYKENGSPILEIYTHLKPSTTSPEAPSNAPSNAPSTSPNSPPTEDAPAPHTSAKPTYTIDLRIVQESEILAQLIARTGATVLKATPEEIEELAEIEEFKERSEKDRVEVREKLAAKRREEEMLKLARGEMVVAT
jgi:large subunit ribosomal protein MRP49